MAEKVLMKGNEAIAEAAIIAGCRHYFGYPITPQTEIAAYMAKRMPKIGGTFLQAESEIAAINMVYGVSAAGKRVMTSSSSPGISLKSEGISYLAGADLPSVVVNCQRGGPGLGGIQPSQSDYFQATRGIGHGDFHLIVLAPSSVQEMYDFTIRAFDLAEQFRTPVILLADEVVGHMREKIEVFSGNRRVSSPKKKYAVSPSTDFFKGANTLVEGQLHDEMGRRIGHMADKSGAFIEKITRKIEDNVDMIADITTYCMEDADVAIVAWGSVARPSLNAVKKARGIKDDRILPKFRVVRDLVKRGVKETMHTDYSHLKVGLIKINTVWPFPEDLLRQAAENVDTVIVPEMNIGKYCREVERALPDKKVIPLPKCGGNIHTPKELLDKILEEVGVDE